MIEGFFTACGGRRPRSLFLWQLWPNRKEVASKLEATPAKQTSLRFRWILGVILLVFFLLLMAAAYLQSPYAKVRSVVVQGASDMSSSMLVNDTKIQIGENLFAVSGQTVAQRLLEDFPIIKSVTMHRELLQQRIVIVIQEKKIAGILESGGVLYRLLSDGTVLDRDPEAVGINLPIITTTAAVTVNLGSQVGDPSVIQLCQELSHLSPAALSSFSELHLEPWQGSTAILAYTKDGFEVRMALNALRSSLLLYDSIHSKLLQLHMQPGLIDLFSSKTGIYTPYHQS